MIITRKDSDEVKAEGGRTTLLSLGEGSRRKDSESSLKDSVVCICLFHPNTHKTCVRLSLIPVPAQSGKRLARPDSQLRIPAVTDCR